MNFPVFWQTAFVLMFIALRVGKRVEDDEWFIDSNGLRNFKAHCMLLGDEKRQSFSWGIFTMSNQTKGGKLKVRLQRYVWIEIIKMSVKIIVRRFTAHPSKVWCSQSIILLFFFTFKTCLNIIMGSFNE